jgi:hypothetical protein
MTVSRTDSLSLSGTHPEIQRQVYDRLSRNPRLRSLTHNDEGIWCRYRPRGWPMVLSTRLYFRFDVSDGRTVVQVTTQSQRYIVGDIFNMYNRILGDMLTEVRQVASATS